MSYGYNVIDTRDLIEEKDELLARLEPVEVGEFAEIVREGIARAHGWIKNATIWPTVGEPLTSEEQDHIVKIDNLLEEVGDEAEYGVALIPEHSFTNYAEDLADDIGAIDSDVSWPNTYIDWERAARDLAMDYSTTEWEGTTYLFRS